MQLHDGPKRILDIIGRVEPMEGIRPGTITVSWHYGHWAYGSHEIDGHRSQPGHHGLTSYYVQGGMVAWRFLAFLG